MSPFVLIDACFSHGDSKSGQDAGVMSAQNRTGCRKLYQANHARLCSKLGVLFPLNNTGSENAGPPCCAELKITCYNRHSNASCKNETFPYAYRSTK